jgi:integrase
MSAPKRPLNNNGSIIIRFTHNKQTFNLSKLGQYDDPNALRFAQSICDHIRIDISNNCFNCQNNGELALKYHPSSINKFITKSIVEKIEVNDSEELINKKIIVQKLKVRLDENYNSAEDALIKILEKYKDDIRNNLDVKNFIKYLKEVRNLKGRSISRYLDCLRQCCNLFDDVKIKIEASQPINVFTKEEITQIINWFYNDKYYSYCADYVLCLFNSGMRISEAIGLQWKHINLTNNEIYIYESLKRKRSNSSQRVRSSTKTNTPRILPLNSSMCEMLKKRYENTSHELNDLVFRSRDGGFINDNDFRRRAWTTCLSELGLQYRKPSITRHCFISHYLAETKNVLKCSSITHNTKSGIQTIYNNYAGIIDKVEVPDLY